MNTRVLLVLAISGIASILFAQQAPLPPLLARPDRLAWEVAISDVEKGPQNDSSSHSQLKMIMSTVSGDLKRDIFVYGEGRKEEIWYKKGFRILPNTDGTHAYVTDPAGDQLEPFQTNLLSGDLFPALSWLAPSLYVGDDTVAGQPCWLFRTGDGKSAASINMNSKLPLKIQSGSTLYFFKYETSVPSLQLPGIYEEAWKRFESLAKRRALIQDNYHKSK